MARPCPVPATIGARGISNLVPGGYKIRPYDMGGEWCARRTAPDPGGWRADVGIGPCEAEPSNLGAKQRLPGGHTGRPYGKTKSVA